MDYAFIFTAMYEKEKQKAFYFARYIVKTLQAINHINASMNM